MASRSPSQTIEASSEAELHRQITRKVAWRVVPLLGTAYFLASLERANLGIAALKMNDALGLTTATFGLAAGIYFIGYFFFEVPSNIALARFGARKWLARIALSWGVVATATALVQGPTSLYIMRILLGIAEAGLFPGVVFYFSLWFLPRDRARILALFIVGYPLSTVLGPPLSGLILSVWRDGFLGLQSWQALFVIEGIPSIIVALLIWRFLVDSPEQAKWLTDAEKSWLHGKLAEHNAPESGNPLRALLHPKVLLLSLAYFTKNCGGYVLIFFMPLVLKRVFGAAGNASTLKVSLLSAVPAAVALVIAILWAAHSDRTGERRWHAALPMFAGAVGIIIAVLSGSPWMIFVGLIVATIGVNSMGSVFFQLPSTFLASATAGIAVAAINATGNLGGFVGPYVFGLLEDITGSFLTGNLVLAVVLVIGGAIILLPVFRVAAKVEPSATPSAGDFDARSDSSA